VCVCVCEISATALHLLNTIVSSDLQVGVGILYGFLNKDGGNVSCGGTVQ
jgi:hypothetical protein